MVLGIDDDERLLVWQHIPDGVGYDDECLLVWQQRDCGLCHQSQSHQWPAQQSTALSWT